MSSRKEDIINTATHLFQNKGYDATTMQDIMHALDIAKGTIYHYFPSKEALFDTVIEKISIESVNAMEKVMAECSGDALQKMEKLICSGNIYKVNKSLIDHLHSPGKEALHTRLLAVTIAQRAPLYASVIEQGCIEGIFQTSCPLECAEFMLSGIQFLTDPGVYPWSESDLKRRLRSFPSILEKQLGAKAGSFAFLLRAMS